MTTKEIIEGNKLIAEFMGWFIVPYCPSGDVWDLDSTTKPLNSNEFKYHSSWDWLMPVIEKIVYKTIPNYNQFKTKDYNYSYSGVFEIRYDSILFTWEEVVSFIKWYNTNKK